MLAKPQIRFANSICLNYGGDNDISDCDVSNELKDPVLDTKSELTGVFLID